MLTWIKVSSVKLNLPQMMKQKEKSVSQLTGGIEGLFKKNKACIYKLYIVKEKEKLIKK